MAKTLAIIGGGAKAAAIVARAAVLRDLPEVGVVPTIEVFERNSVGSAWSGAGGFSSGYLTLCSPAEKDVGFPYTEVSAWTAGIPVAPAIFARFSWQAFLVATGRYAEWVDRGRDFPSHSVWSEYLAWVFVEADQGAIQGDVKSIEAQSGGGWHIEYEVGGSTHISFADAVVLTGTGDARQIAIDPSAARCGRVYDAETFWDARDKIVQHNEIAVAGSGGAAGTIVAWLAQALAEKQDATIRSLSSMGTLFPRGDGFAERRWFSDPTDWKTLRADDRRKLLERTEEGVISLRNKSVIDAAPNVDYVRGHAAGVAWDGDELRVDLEYRKRSTGSIKADILINAIGFDQWSLIKLVKAAGVADLLKDGAETVRSKIAADMDGDLSLPASAGLGAGLHVPSLGAFAHGPGMATLGCLGLMAQSVLDGYLE